ncbi:hypothetical protein BDF19DRAFT_494302 [Syncephalis fuscata]|nr:hypothetical protein BDF19DRAFT_494302 [Syncephalis fuscata]
MTNIKLTQLNDWFVNARRRMLPKVLNERDTFLNVHDMMQTNIPFSTTITPSSEQNSLFYPTQPHYNYAGWLAELINNNAQISELSIEQLQLQALCLMLPNACNTLVMPTTDDCTDQVLQAYQSTSENANMTTNSLIHDLNVLNNNATSNTSTNTTSIENIAHKNATDVWPTTTCTPHNNC